MIILLIKSMCLHNSLYFLANSIDAPRWATLIVTFKFCEFMLLFNISLILFIIEFKIFELFSNISNYNNLFSFSSLGIKFCNIDSENWF